MDFIVILRLTAQVQTSSTNSTPDLLSIIIRSKQVSQTEHIPNQTLDLLPQFPNNSFFFNLVFLVSKLWSFLTSFFLRKLTSYPLVNYAFSSFNFINWFILSLFLSLCVYMCICQRTTYRGQFFVFSIWVPGV